MTIDVKKGYHLPGSTFSLLLLEVLVVFLFKNMFKILNSNKCIQYMEDLVGAYGR